MALARGYAMVRHRLALVKFCIYHKENLFLWKHLTNRPFLCFLQFGDSTKKKFLEYTTEKQINITVNR